MKWKEKILPLALLRKKMACFHFFRTHFRLFSHISAKYSTVLVVAQLLFASNLSLKPHPVNFSWQTFFVLFTLCFEHKLWLCMCMCVNLIHMSAGRLHRRHLHKRSFTCLRHVWGWSGVTAHCQNRSCGPSLKLVESLPYANSPVVYLCGADVNRSIERAWIELEGIEAIVKTASKAKFFIEFHSSCLEGRRGGGSLLFKVFFCSAAAAKNWCQWCLFL